jgi:hypothetical protein
MNHKIIIPIPVKKVYYPNKSVPVYQNSIQIGDGVVYTINKEKMAQTALNCDCDLTAMGKMVIREGDIIDELHITALYIKI